MDTGNALVEVFEDSGKPGSVELVSSAPAELVDTTGGTVRICVGLDSEGAWALMRELLAILIREEADAS